MQHNFNIGDIVKIHDGSYSAQVSDGKLIHAFGNELNIEDHTILAIGTFPCFSSFKHIKSNDLMIQGNVSKNVTFIQSRFCKLVPKKCSCCGQIISNNGDRT